jgi:fused signal recognition particle receptor
MFKFLKDKLKGALSAFSKKVEETAKEETQEVEETSAEAPASATSEAAEEVTAEQPAVPSEKPSKLTEPEAQGAEVAEELIEELEKANPEPEEPADVPKITLPKEKKGFFSTIKKMLGGKEELPREEITATPAEKPMFDEIVIESADMQVEGSPLRKVDIHQHIEEERPAVEQLFEPIEPKQVKPEKKQVASAEEMHPDKVKARIVGEGKDPNTLRVKEYTRALNKKDTEMQPLVDFAGPKAANLIGKIKEEEIKKIQEPLKTKQYPPISIPSADTKATKLSDKPVKSSKLAAPEKKGFFSRLREAVTTKKITAQQFEELFWEFEVALLENNVALEVIEKIKQDLKLALVDQPIPRGNVETTILGALKRSLEDLFTAPEIDLLQAAKTKKPLIICFVGINGSGKTTTIAKVAHLFKTHGLDVVLAAADTFRAAAIDQLQEHANRLQVKLIKHDYGSDPAAVAFDAIKHAQATNKDVVLIDTAGRLHSNINLVDEMKKIVRVAKPDLTLFIGESITGNDCVEQAKQFNEAVGIDGIVLSKADIDEKGGAAISVSYVTKKPILYLGVGQEYDDLKKFDPRALLESLGL